MLPSRLHHSSPTLLLMWQLLPLIFALSASAQLPPIDPAQISEIGKEVYQAVQDNQPTIDLSTDWAGAVPAGIDDWTSMKGWQGPSSSVPFYLEFKNGLGAKLTRFDWTFAWKWGGSYNGTGQYVTQAGINIIGVYAYLTEHIDVKVTSQKPLNYGSAEAPIGGLDITVSITSHGLFEKTTKACTMTVRGDGTFLLGACAQGDVPGTDRQEAAVLV